MKSTHRLPTRGRGVGLASLLLYRQEVLRLLIDFLCLGKITVAKIKPTECDVHGVLWVLTIIHNSAAGIHQEIVRCMNQCYEPKFTSKKTLRNRVCLFV